MKTLVIVEHNQQNVKPATLHALSAAKALNAPIDVIIIGEHCQNVVTSLQQFAGIQQVLVADNTVYAHQLAENTAALIATVAKEYDYILAASTTFGKNLLPRVAALLKIGMLSDVMTVVTPDTFTRPMYAGNVIATVKTLDKIKLLSIRTTAFPAATEKSATPASTVTLTTVIPNTQAVFEKEELTHSARPELTDARVVIAGGRGLKSAENFKLLESIADALGAAIGASRAAVDAGFAPNDYQVGQTGKVVAPDLYIAVGISGAIQHVAGMKDSKIVVAINNDPEAPIFQVADYEFVGDLFKILAELKNSFKKQ